MIVADRDEDLKLIKRIQKNKDKEAFEMLVVKYHPGVIGLCQSFFWDKGKSEDAAQIVFMKLWKSKLKTFKGKSSFRTYLYTVTVRTCLDLLKKEKGEIPFSQIERK